MQKEIDNIINSSLEGESEYNPDPDKLISLAKNLLDGKYSNIIIHSFLEIGHFPHVNKIFFSSDLRDEWLNHLFRLIEKSKYHTGILLKQRAMRYKNNVLFQRLNGEKLETISYSDAWNRIVKIGCSLSDIIDEIKHPVVGIYAPNSFKVALIDLACLSFNIKNVPIPANVSELHLEYIIKHSGITHLIISGTEQANRINKIIDNVGDTTFIVLPKTPVRRISALRWRDLQKSCSADQKAKLMKRMGLTKMHDDATIMYTSGTTANPKGIIFTQANMITKRFARALALNDVSSKDTFLCYLPLYHTFGRYLEMMGSIFWGSTYTFAVVPSFKSILNNLSRIKPSIFISIPKRWIQLYDLIISTLSSQGNSSENIQNAFNDVLGGNLRLGLSAAGYLDPDVFTFFHKNNVHLLSGYGMTEATGGITMTPQDDYVRDSVGRALPGIEIKLADDNELLLKGPYVTAWYHGKNKKSSLKNGWFHTGDIFEEKNGHYFIVDRKKEIYKNSRGVTIAPQKIENLFQDFDAVKSIFLVGDGRPYNTVLIYPNQEWLVSTKNLANFELNDFFSSLLQSVNSFLAPIERIVNFSLIDRDFSIDKNELTPKKTFKRKVILNNFSRYITPMYEKDYDSFVHNNTEIRIPKWLLRKADIIANDLSWDGEYLLNKNNDKSLTIIQNYKNIIIGDYDYVYENEYLDFKKIVISPELWLGNKQFVDYFGFEALNPKHFETSASVEIANFQFHYTKVEPSLINDLRQVIRDKIYDLNHLHFAAIAIFNGYDFSLTTAINYLSKMLGSDKYELIDITIKLLTRLCYHPSTKIKLKSLEVLTPAINGDLFIQLYKEIYSSTDEFTKLNEIDFDVQILKTVHYTSILQILSDLANENSSHSESKIILIKSLINIISDYTILHPTEYRWTRAELVKWQLSLAPQPIIELAEQKLNELTVGFRQWLGPVRSIAIDHESSEEYSWKDVITFDPSVSTELQDILYEAISGTQIIKETYFILSNHRLIQLDNIQLRGVWIMQLSESSSKNVFRATIQTRDNTTFNFTIKLHKNVAEQEIIDEINFLITTGLSSHGYKLVEDFGGYWSKYKLYTEEYVQGETVQQYLARNESKINSDENKDLWQLRWLHFIWNGLMAYFNFFKRSNYEYYIANSSLNNLIIPERDYEIGTRLVSISEKTTLTNYSAMLLSLYSDLILQTEKRYSGLSHVADWEVIFCALLQTVTVKKGINILQKLVAELDKNTNNLNFSNNNLTIDRINKFIEDVNENGLLTKPIVFASLRYERWFELNPNATLTARNAMIKQLYADYHLGNFINDYPESRIRFFLMTAFKDSPNNLREELLNLQREVRAKTIVASELDEKINEINKNIEISPEEEFFLARLIFEHIDSKESEREFVWDAGSEGKLDLITALTDSLGENHQIRQPVHPKEIIKFQSLLINANLSAVFNTKHEFLFIINYSNQLIGGVYWNKIDDKTAYLERIVIAPKYRKRQLSSLLLDELFARLKDKQFNYITVGFFQAGLFYNKGFYIDKRFGGLVKDLAESS